MDTTQNEMMTCAWCGASTDDAAAFEAHYAEHCDVCGDPDGCVHTWKVGDVVEVRRNAFEWFRAEVTGVDGEHDAVAYRTPDGVGITTSANVRNREAR
jgi:transcription antitermination factor NusG